MGFGCCVEGDVRLQRRRVNSVILQVLPILEEGFGHREQREMVWHTLREMPLRLLERVLPWLAGESYLTATDGIISRPTSQCLPSTELMRSPTLHRDKKPKVKLGFVCLRQTCSARSSLVSCIHHCLIAMCLELRMSRAFKHSVPQTYQFTPAIECDFAQDNKRA